MGGYLITKNIYQIYLNFSQEHSTMQTNNFSVKLLTK